MYSLLRMMLWLVISSFSARAVTNPLIEPPFVRQWTHLTGGNATFIAQRDGVIYYGSHNGLGAIYSTTGQQKWRALTGKGIASAVIHKDEIFAVIHFYNHAELVRVKINTRQSQFIARLQRDTGSLVIDKQRLYVLDGSTLRAYDLATARVLWVSKLAEFGSGSMSRLVPTADALYVGLDEVGDFGIEPKNGRILWHRKAHYAGLYKPIVIGGDVITEHNSFRRTNVRSGKVIWQAGESYGDAVLLDNLIIHSSSKDLVARDASSGKVRWRLPLRDAGTSYGGSEDAPSISDGKTIWLMRQPVLGVTKEGREKWQHPAPFTGTPVYADSAQLITLDEFRFLSYKMGQLPTLPASGIENQAFAERQAKQWELLDDAEIAQLQSLGSMAFEPLLQRYVEWAKAEDAENENDVPAADSYRRYSQLTDMSPVLHAVFERAETSTLIKALSQFKNNSSWRGVLEKILQDKGDQQLYIPLLVENLRRLPLKERRESPALDAIAHSTHPQAVALLLEALRDTKASPSWRKKAFLHLAGTGGNEGVQAVQEAKTKRGQIKPWFERVPLGKLPADFIASTKKDGKGRTWMLFYSGILGNYSDLFIAQKIGSNWGKPLFTGAWTGRTFRQEPPKTFRGIPLKKLVETEWVSLFSDDATLRRDADKDGLTDIVEKRLSTNANKRDTDGDGIADAVDHCPNATPRVLDDNEKIVAACVEARFFLEDWGVPAVISVENTKPFELYGYKPLLIWQGAKEKSVLDSLYGGGVNFVSFHAADRESQQPKPFIEYSPDRLAARTVIRRYSGGLNGDGYEATLKKIDGEWFVTGLVMRYVS